MSRMILLQNSVSPPTEASRQSYRTDFAQDILCGQRRTEGRSVSLPLRPTSSERSLSVLWRTLDPSSCNRHRCKATSLVSTFLRQPQRLSNLDLPPMRWYQQLCLLVWACHIFQSLQVGQLAQEVGRLMDESEQLLWCKLQGKREI